MILNHNLFEFNNFCKSTILFSILTKIILNNRNLLITTTKRERFVLVDIKHQSGII